MILFFSQLQKDFRFSFNLDLYTLDSLICIQEMQKTAFFPAKIFIRVKKKKDIFI